VVRFHSTTREQDGRATAPPATSTTRKEVVMGNRYGRLVLTRREGESVEIGDVTVTVHQVRDGSVRLAIEAHPDIKVLRTELVADAEERPGSTGQGGC
jgi:carbon storage regulator CsrA